MNLKFIALIVILAIANCQDDPPTNNTTTPVSCANHPMEKEWNNFKVDSESYLETSAVMEGDIQFCKGLKGKQTCCKEAGFTQIKEKFNKRFNDMKTMRKDKVAKWDARKKFRQQNANDIVTYQAKYAALTEEISKSSSQFMQKLVTNLNETENNNSTDPDTPKNPPQDNTTDPDANKTNPDAPPQRFLAIEEETPKEGETPKNERDNSTSQVFNQTGKSFNDYEKQFSGDRFDYDEYKQAQAEEDDIDTEYIEKEYNMSKDQYNMTMSNTDKVDMDKQTKANKKDAKPLMKESLKAMQKAKNNIFNTQRQCFKAQFKMLSSIACMTCRADFDSFITEGKKLKLSKETKQRVQMACFPYVIANYELGEEFMSSLVEENELKFAKKRTENMEAQAKWFRQEHDFEKNETYEDYQKFATKNMDLQKEQNDDMLNMIFENKAWEFTQEKFPEDCQPLDCPMIEGWVSTKGINDSMASFSELYPANITNGTKSWGMLNMTDPNVEVDREMETMKNESEQMQNVTDFFNALENYTKELDQEMQDTYSNYSNMTNITDFEDLMMDQRILEDTVDDTVTVEYSTIDNDTTTVDAGNDDNSVDDAEVEVDQTEQVDAGDETALNTIDENSSTTSDETSSDSGTPIWVYIVGGLAALLLIIGVCVLITSLTKKNEDHVDIHQSEMTSVQ